ncbi:MAG: tetratricopeptide repeat protein [Woeseia sp.]
MRRFLALRVALMSLVLASPGWGDDFAKGFYAYSEGDYAAALAVWQPLAEEGEAHSQFGMGLLNANGWGLPLDDAAALKWYKLAAGQGHAEAQYNIGVMYQNGWGVDQDDSEAFKWHEAAAESGFPAAQRSLGNMYANGLGTQVDRTRAYMWLEIAAMLGDSDANFNREGLEPSMAADEVSAAGTAAAEWIEKFATLHPQIPIERQ